MDRVYNVEKSRKRVAVDSIDDTPRKRGRPKQVTNLVSRYPPLQHHGNDPSQQQQTSQAILKEMEKEKPRKDILLPLLRSTFCVRRQYILESNESVIAKLEKFPALKMPPLVGFNNVWFYVGMSQENPRDVWPKFSSTKSTKLEWWSLP